MPSFLPAFMPSLSPSFPCSFLLLHSSLLPSVLLPSVSLFLLPSVPPSFLLSFHQVARPSLTVVTLQYMAQSIVTCIVGINLGFRCVEVREGGKEIQGRKCKKERGEFQ